MLKYVLHIFSILQIIWKYKHWKKITHLRENKVQRMIVISSIIRHTLILFRLELCYTINNLGTIVNNYLVHDISFIDTIYKFITPVQFVNFRLPWYTKRQKELYLPERTTKKDSYMYYIFKHDKFSIKFQHS